MATIKKGGLVLSETRVGHFAMEVERITGLELELIYEKVVPLRWSKILMEIATGDERKKRWNLESSISPDGKSEFRLESKVEFWRIGTVWSPRDLRLRINGCQEAIKFKTIDLYDAGGIYSYTIEGPVDPKTAK